MANTLSLDEAVEASALHPRILTRLIERGDLKNVGTADEPRFDAEEIADTAIRSRIERAKLLDSIANQEQIRRDVILELAGVDDETATRLGF